MSTQILNRTAGKTELPKYAWPYRHPAAQRGDVGATFYEDEGGGTISVYIQVGDGETFYFNTDRGGMSESRFSRQELARVLEVAAALAKHAGMTT